MNDCALGVLPSPAAADRGEAPDVGAATSTPGPGPNDALGLPWLVVAEDWAARIRTLEQEPDREAAWAGLVALANTRLDMLRTSRLDRVVRRHFADAGPPGLATKAERLAILGGSTLAHLVPAIRVGALRRGIWVTVYEGQYGQYFGDLSDPASMLHRFQPTAVLLAFDATHLTQGADPAADAVQAEATVSAALRHIGACWRLARDLGSPVLQQTALPVFPALLGDNEHRLPGSRAALLARFNAALRPAADAAGVDLLAVDVRAGIDGLSRWHDPVLWWRGKQEVRPAAAPLYGDLVGRWLAARQGRSAKCLVLDLDNTIWGGVIGDDGVEGLVLGQGSALGEAFVAVQAYAAALARRGVILAVCSKNDEANALAAFEHHPEMVLKRSDIACFVANWDDKAANLRVIAQRLNIGLDALVFVDDNAFERNLVRQALPMVAVPEVPDDPALIPACLADAGYFESVAVTEEDRVRSSQYQANSAREALKDSATDISDYLRGLRMELVWRRFDTMGLPRIVQLINKTNQFNLTTRRYTEAEIRAVMDDPAAFGLQFRLLDRFGDNGIIAIVIGRRGEAEDEAVIDTWLMSCRVLGRGVEQATLAVTAEAARAFGARRLIGEYRLTAKNSMVRDHYRALGFTPISHTDDGASRSSLDLDGFAPAATFISLREG